MTFTANTSSINKIKSFLPASVANALTRLDFSALERISEIRLRSNGTSTVTIDGKNEVITLGGISKYSSKGIITTSEDIENFVYKFCKGSVYSHEETLSEFFITNDSIRVGLGGDGIYKSGKLVSIGNISSICIRLPRHINDCSLDLYKHIKKHGFNDGKGILIASSPGVGKTTLLRDLAIKLSDTANEDFRRVCIIDERNEIYMNKLFDRCCVDFLKGIDKIKGMEIAGRVLSPEIIICDEIATPEEAEKITRQKNTGVVFIASVHSKCGFDATKKDYIRKMFTEGVFSHTYSLERCDNTVKGTLNEFSND